MITRSKSSPSGAESVNYLLILMSFLLQICSSFGVNTPINGNFNFCNEASASILSMDNACKISSSSSIENENLNDKFNDNKEYLVFDQMKNMVSGIGYECYLEKIVWQS